MASATLLLATKKVVGLINSGELKGEVSPYLVMGLTGLSSYSMAKAVLESLEFKGLLIKDGNKYLVNKEVVKKEVENEAKKEADEFFNNLY